MSKPKAFQPVLSWRSPKLGWKEFQKLSLLLYQYVFKDFFAEEFLKLGHFQDGIDVLSFKNSTGRNTCIQAKHYVHLGLSDLKDIVNLFLESDFLPSSDTFIITTSADLQHPDIQEYIQTQKMFFHNSYQIKFDCWDVTRMEDYLKGQFRIVHFYFSLDEAKKHCFEPEIKKVNYAEWPGYIERNIKDLKNIGDESLYYPDARKRSTLTLDGLLKEKYLQPQHLCIIAEAYEGKTKLFEQTAFQLSNGESPYTVLLLTLKSETIQSIETLLQIHYDTWMSVAAKDLVVLIDGLDEVPSDRFLDMVNHIKDFSIVHPFIHIAFSCRKLFFSDYKVESELLKFDHYELMELSYGQSLRYMNDQLGINREAFFKRIRLFNLENLLATPFYLTKLVTWYKVPGQAFPENKSEIAQKFVEESIDLSGSRKLVGGRQLRHSKVRYKKLLIALAFALQVKGVNSADAEFIQELFILEDRDLLIHSSILNVNNNSWAFVNAFFQEQLSALALAKYPVETIYELITVGKEVKKIKTKWIQTVCTYLSQLDQFDIKREQLIALIEKDNVELLALSEGNKFTEQFRLDILAKIIAKTVYHHARLSTIDESDLADFIGDDGGAIAFLIEKMQSSAPIIVKITCIRTLQHMKFTTAHSERFKDVAVKQIIENNDAYYARLLIENLARLKLGTQEMIDQLTSNNMVEHHEYREGVYQLISTQGLIEANYQFLLDGFEILYQYNQGVSHMGSEKRILKILVQTEQPVLIRKLFKEITKNNFQHFFRHQKESINEFVTELQSKASIVFKKDPAIIFSVMHFITELTRFRENDGFSNIIDFFKTTGEYRLGLRVFLNEKDEHKRSYVFSDTITSECFDILLYAAEEGDITMHQLRTFVSGLQHNNKEEEAKKLEKLIEDAFGKPDIEITKQQNRYWISEKNKQDNDLKYIVSADSFAKGIKSIFKTLKKEEISLNDLNYKYDEEYFPLIKVNSHLAQQFLRDHADERRVTLKYCLARINDQNHFSLWRVQAILNYHLLSLHSDYFMLQLKDYYDATVIKFPFSDINIDSLHEDKKRAGQYLKIWEKYEFPTPDHVLLDFLRMNGEGFDCLQFAKTNKRKSITAMLMARFVTDQQSLIIKVLENLKNGLRHSGVLGAHIEICEQLKISAAVPEILKLIYKNELPYGNSYHLIDAFVALGGSLSELLPYFNKLEDIDNYEFILLVKILYKGFPNEVLLRLDYCFRYPNVSLDRNLEAAKWMAILGDKNGFAYIIDQLDPQNPSPYHIQSKFPIWQVDTDWALDILEPKMIILVDDTLPKFRMPDSPELFLLEILQGFAAKSENDLQKVKTFLIGQERRFVKKFPSKAGHLVFHAEIMEENFRQKTNEMVPNDQIKQLISNILQ
ncbi:MAG: hypothetical protein JWR38_480 [Mucilaginibacter sp.]|nr:hypothetical protein [Mucilaginibacter sp.]